MIGDDVWGKKILANLKSEGVSDELLSVTEDEKTSFSIILNSFEGERTVLNFLGANNLFTEEFFPLRKIMQTKWIFLNHLSGNANCLIKKIELIMQKQGDISLAWNPGGIQLEEGAEKNKELISKTKIIFLNKEEAEKFTNLKCAEQKTHIVKIENQKHVCQVYKMNQIFEYLKKLGADIIVITDGRRGSQAYNGIDTYFCPVFDLQRTDTLGAGDAFASGFTGAMILNKTLQTALKFGTINATSVVQHYGAQKGLLSLAEISERYNDLKTIKIN